MKVQPVELAFLGVRVLGVFMAMEAAGPAFLLLGTLNGPRFGNSPRHATYEVWSLVVETVFAVWLFFFADKIASGLARKVGSVPAALAFGLVGLTIGVTAASNLPHLLGQWSMLRQIGSDQSAPLFEQGVVPSNPYVARECALLLSGALLMAVARPLALISDPDERRRMAAIRDDIDRE